MSSRVKFEVPDQPTKVRNDTCLRTKRKKETKENMSSLKKVEEEEESVADDALVSSSGVEDKAGEGEGESAETDAAQKKRKRKRKRKRKKKAEDEEEEAAKGGDGDGSAANAAASTKATAAPSSLTDATVYVEGIPFDADEDTVRAFFEDGPEGQKGAGCGKGTVLELRLPVWQDSGRLKGYGHVKLSSEDAVTKAVSLK